MILWARVGSLTDTKWDNGGGMEPAGSCIGYCVIRKERHRLFPGASGEVADLPFGLNVVAIIN